MFLTVVPLPHFPINPVVIYFAILHSIALFFFFLMYMLYYNTTDYILKERTMVL